MTNTVLDKILAHKEQEIAIRKERISLEQMRHAAVRLSMTKLESHDMMSALRIDSVALIAEVKHASPSKGVLIEDFDPVAIGTTYAENGAAAISVLTDEEFFRGSLQYLKQVGEAVSLPILRKDFIIDPYQVYESKGIRANALLLIVAALTDARLEELYALTYDLDMVALVEVHNEAEMERALRLEAKLIGINNRDLKTFDVNLETTARLATMVPNDVTLVAESGIKDAEDVRRIGQLGAHAVLVGESLVKSSDMAATVRAFSKQRRV